MPDTRRHRGPHPRDAELFAPPQLPKLRDASVELSWLLGRGYSDRAALALVGDRHQLHLRQRSAIQRAACPPALAEARRRKRVDLVGRTIAVDGFNVLITAEAAICSAPLIRCHDGLVRDLSGVHGSYRRVEESARALRLLVDRLSDASSVTWHLDRQVSNSGRVAAAVRALGHEAVLSDTVDGDLAAGGSVLATADGPLLDRVPLAVDLIGLVVDGLAPAWVVDLTPNEGRAVSSEPDSCR